MKRRILNVKQQDHVPNTGIRRRSKVTDVREKKMHFEMDLGWFYPVQFQLLNGDQEHKKDKK